MTRAHLRCRRQCRRPDPYDERTLPHYPPISPDAVGLQQWCRRFHFIIISKSVHISSTSSGGRHRRCTLRSFQQQWRRR
eukprot:scaffold2681_cov69-Alexandrium_tamarense.AAC.1